MVELTQEQEQFLALARGGKNVLVEACIGSGKTTAIQELCRTLPVKKKVLYLTYNKLLKTEAKSKIKQKNVTVTNYHGFAWMALKQIGITVGITDIIQTFLSVKPPIRHYDVLVLDEYQDIDMEISRMLELIKEANPQIQIVAVGDMDQKIYDKTALNAAQFIHAFLENYQVIEFTNCFRLNKEWAEKLGMIWNKEITGVNKDCVIESMTEDEAAHFLSKCEPGDILCLGSRTGSMSHVLNMLEEDCSEKFNKRTVYASIEDRDAGAVQPDDSVAIFTTYDSSKGMERRICVVFDFTEAYWKGRLEKPQQSYKILRNIFCVAASRGKERIIFVRTEEAPLTMRSLAYNSRSSKDKYQDVDISEMFDFKFKEDVEECFRLINVEDISDTDDQTPINIKTTDGLIDLSPCIGVYQEAKYFKNYSVNEAIEHFAQVNPDKRFYAKNYKKLSLEKKILLLTAMRTGQNRYVQQVKTPFIEEHEVSALVARLKTQFKKNEDVQVACQIDFPICKGSHTGFTASGLADVVKDFVVHELKFVSELTHEHFLQCATYVVALELEEGVVWNVRTNKRFKVTIPDKKKFLDCVAKTITKGSFKAYCGNLV